MVGDGQGELDQAWAELDAFRAREDDRTRIRRLAAECPWHPLLLLSHALFGMALGLGTGGLALAVAPWTGHEMALALARTDPAGVLAPAAVVVAACAAIAGISTRKSASVRGADSPLLPEEARAHQRLAGEVLRLQCRQQRLARAA